MNLNEYQKLALTTAKPELTDNDPIPSTIGEGLGIAGEAGEVADEIKKEYFHGHPRNHAKVAKELGDVLWYLAVLAHRYGYELDEIARQNIAKLKARYPEGFSTERSLNRAEGK